MDEETTLQKALELQAEIQHNIWSSWMIYMFDQCIVTQFGEWIIPTRLVLRWQKQMRTPYADLLEKEKQSDRDIVEKFGLINLIPKEEDK